MSGFSWDILRHLQTHMTQFRDSSLPSVFLERLAALRHSMASGPAQTWTLEQMSAEWDLVLLSAVLCTKNDVRHRAINRVAQQFKGSG